MKKTMLITILGCLLVFAGVASAAMGSGMMGGITPSSMMGGGMNMMGTGGFGMMNGMAGAPVVDSNGTAYVITLNPGTSAGAVPPTSNSFQSVVSAITPSAQISTITLKGIVSRPVVSGNLLVATASLPDMTNYSIINPSGSTPTGQSVLYAVTLPMDPSKQPVAVSMDGQFASLPVVTDDKVYVMTTDFGNAMMQGNTTFSNMMGSFNFNNAGTARTFLYIVNFDGSIAARIQLQ